MIYVVTESSDFEERYPIFASTSKDKAQAKIKELEEKHHLSVKLLDFVQGEIAKWKKELPVLLPPTLEEKSAYEKKTGKSPLIWTGPYREETVQHILDIEYKSKLYEQGNQVEVKRKQLCRELEEKHSLEEDSIWNGAYCKYRMVEVESD